MRTAHKNPEAVKAEGQELTEAGTHTFTGLTASTEYYIYALPVNAEGDFGELRSEYAKTKCDAAPGQAALELNVAVVPGFVIADAMPNSATSEYHYAFVTVAKFEEWGEELAIFNLLRDNAPICGDDFWQVDIAYFQEGVDYYCYGIGYTTHQWGANDDITFNRLYDLIMEQGNGPWHITFLTLSSHEPWTVPYNRIKEDKIANAFAFTDEELGKFIDRFKDSDNWENTLIVCISDHSVVGYPKGITQSDINRNHIPLLMLGGAIKEPKRIGTICNQTDLVATLLPKDDVAI